MAISIFPSTAAEFVSNNFVVDMNDTTNNTADTGGVKQAGPYSMSFSSGDSSFDVYLIDDEGNSVGYSNSTSINASGLFTTVVILGVAQDEIISFTYQGSVNNADGEGDEPGAGAYLESISPSDLPSIDDTATVTGGNFGANTEITFESGATVLSAKSITVVSGTELLVTRPDGLIEDNSPYDLKAINTGVTPPSSIDFVLTDAVTAGSDPTWVTTSPLDIGVPGQAFSQTLEATDTEGTVVDYSVTAGTITPGLTLNSSTGVLSGTPTTGGNYTFTVTATDDGGNTTDKEFEQFVGLAVGGTVVENGGFTYHTFASSDDLEVLAEITDLEYLVIAGGGSGGGNTGAGKQGGGGGAGGVTSGTSTLSAGNYSITVGAGGAAVNTGSSQGSDSSLGSISTSTGGGGGGFFGSSLGKNGGSGGGSGKDSPGAGGTGIAGQGNNGGTGGDDSGGGGGGAGAVGQNGSGNQGGAGGAGTDSFSDWATDTSTGDGGFFAGGGGGGSDSTSPGGAGGSGGGADGGQDFPTIQPVAADSNSGGGGGGCIVVGAGSSGGSGIVIVRYAS